MKPSIHIGEEIRKQLTDQKRSVAWLAAQLGSDPSNFRKLLKNPYIATDLLYRISQTLGNDFFACYSKRLSEDTVSGKIYPKNR